MSELPKVGDAITVVVHGALLVADVIMHMGDKNFAWRAPSARTERSRIERIIDEGTWWIRGQHLDDAEARALLTANALVRGRNGIDERGFEHMAYKLL